MGGRKHRQRTTVLLKQEHAVPCPQRHGVVVRSATEAIMLPVAGDVAPAQALVVVSPQSAQASPIDIGHRRLGSGRDCFLAHKAGAAIDREPQAALERPQLQAVEGDFQPDAIAPHTTGTDVIADARARDFAGVTWESGVDSCQAGHVQGGVPEHLPLLALDDIRRGFAAQIGHRVELLLGDTPPALGNIELWPGIPG